VNAGAFANSGGLLGSALQTQDATRSKTSVGDGAGSRGGFCHYRVDHVTGVIELVDNLRRHETFLEVATALAVEMDDIGQTPICAIGTAVTRWSNPTIGPTNDGDLTCAITEHDTRLPDKRVLNDRFQSRTKLYLL